MREMRAAICTTYTTTVVTTYVCGSMIITPGWLTALLFIATLGLSFEADTDPTIELVDHAFQYGNDTDVAIEPSFMITTLAINAQPQLTEEEFHDNDIVQKLFHTYTDYKKRAHAMPMMLPLAPQCTTTTTAERTLFGMLKQYLTTKLFGLSTGSSTNAAIGPTLWQIAVVGDEIYEIGVKTWVCHAACVPPLSSRAQWAISALEMWKKFHKDNLPYEIGTQLNDAGSEWKYSVRALKTTDDMKPVQFNRNLWSSPLQDWAC